MINVDNEDNTCTVRDSIIDYENSTVRYKNVLEVAIDLYRTVSDDPKLWKSTYTSLHEWIAKLRSGDGFDVVFNNNYLPKDVGIGLTQEPHPDIFQSTTPMKETSEEINIQSRVSTHFV